MRVPRGEKAEHAWNEKFAAYQQQFPELAAELTRRMNGALPEDFAAIARDYVAKTAGRARRKSPAARLQRKRAERLQARTSRNCWAVLRILRRVT
ncbi:hypothetical protein ACB264_23815 [Klebsiella pneumoniae]